MAVNPDLYPEDHKLGMQVPQGGSACSKCEYLKPGNKCGAEGFIAWAGPNKPAGSNKIPLIANRYCCDLFESR